MINIKRSTPTVRREITPHFDQKGKYSQKRAWECTILKSKVHLATSGSRVWPVTIFNTVLYLFDTAPFRCVAQETHLSLEHYTCESYLLAVQWISDISLIHLDLHEDISVQLWRNYFFASNYTVRGQKSEKIP